MNSMIVFIVKVVLAMMKLNIEILDPLSEKKPSEECYGRSFAL